MTFASRYGPWALVLGASEGLGAAFATELANRGVNLVLVARRADALAELSAGLCDRVTVRVVALDLSSADAAQRLVEATSDLEVGLVVYNAAASTLGRFLDQPVDSAQRSIDVNVRGPTSVVHAFAPAMVARRRGGIVLMSSLAGFQGGPRLAAYVASKAWLIVFGESLWAELRPSGVDVVVSCPGAVRTPNYKKTSATEAPGILDAAYVASISLDGLGRGPVVVPGFVNRLARFVLGRLMTRAGAVGIMESNTRGLVPQAISQESPK